jgi:hypothetical protein
VSSHILSQIRYGAVLSFHCQHVAAILWKSLGLESEFTIIDPGVTAEDMLDVIRQKKLTLQKPAVS